MNKRSGLTMTSIVMYVVIFFALTILATGVTMAMNSNSLQDKGKIYVEEENLKIKKNIKLSLDNSQNVYKIEDKLIFSNGDEYFFDNTTRTLYKNGGVLSQNLLSFEISIKEKNNITYGVNIKYSIEKYNQNKTFEFSLFKEALDFEI